MYPRATDGNRQNNDVFSPCSNSAIEQILLTKTDCFTSELKISIIIMYVVFKVSL